MEKEIIKSGPNVNNSVFKIIIVILAIISMFSLVMYYITSYVRGFGSLGDITSILYIGSIPLLIIICIMKYWLTNCEIVVTNRRVYGTAAFHKRVDLPLNKISAVSTSSFNGIAVGTSSGIINFKLINNNLEIHRALTELLMTRQVSNNNSTVSIVNNGTDLSSELKKYKELLDNNLITPEDYEKKKNELLGL